MSEIVRPHGKITKNPDGSFTVTTNSGYQFNIQSLTHSTALGESTLDLLIQIADVIGQMLEQTSINTSTNSISVKKVKKA